MKKALFVLLSAAIASQVLLTGCSENDSGDDTNQTTSLRGGLRVYPAQISCPDCTDIPESRLGHPSLVLDENDSTFELFCGALSSTIYRGTYKLVDGYLMTASYGDYPEMFNFAVNEDGTLTFIAEGSGKVIVYPGMHGIELTDGTVFG